MFSTTMDTKDTKDLKERNGFNLCVLCVVLCVLCVLSFVACGKPTPPAAAAREDAYRANNLGVALLEQFKYPEAAAAFRGRRPTVQRDGSL